MTSPDQPISKAISASQADTSKPFFPLAGVARDGFSNANEASATCFCGAVQLGFPVTKPGLVDTFACNCYDCRKLTATMFATNFTVRNPHIRNVRGEETLRAWANSTTPAGGDKGHVMTNFFCPNCGTLMYRRGSAFPGCSFMRVGTVDDFSLHETILKPRVESYVKDRVSWLHGLADSGVIQYQGFGV